MTCKKRLYDCLTIEEAIEYIDKKIEAGELTVEEADEWFYNWAERNDGVREW